MNMKVTRRDLLALAGGSAVGLALSPAPWKLIDDLSIWTQNWKWIPRPPKGPISARLTRCSLCPAACAMEARCVAGSPVSMHAAEGAAALCALGLTAHHLPYHPARFSSPVKLIDGRRIQSTAAKAARTAANAISSAEEGGKRVAVLDSRAGRSTSSAWRLFLADFKGGVAIPAPGREGASLTTLDAMLNVEPGTCALDLERARTIVSFGAPLAEGWGSPHTAARLALRANDQQLVTIEPNRSKTAELAHRWIPVNPGSEGALALGIAHVLFAEGLVRQTPPTLPFDQDEYRAIADIFTPPLAARLTGVPAKDILSLARDLAANSPVVAFAGEEPGSGRFGQATETAILGLNVLLGSVDLAGGIARRRPLPEPFGDRLLAAIEEIESIAEGSLAVLIMDLSAGEALFPWPLMRSKLAPGALVIALSPFLAGTATHADFVLPTLPMLEGLQETLPAVDSPRSSFGISAPLLAAREGAIDPVEFLGAVSAALGKTPAAASSEELMRMRTAAIFESGRGAVVNPVDASAAPLTGFDSADALWESLAAGTLWIDDDAKPAAIPKIALTRGIAEDLKLLAEEARPTNARRQLAVLARATRDVAASAAVSPVLTKLYQESGLRRAPLTAAVNPRTVSELSLRDGRIAHLETAAGTIPVAVASDESVMPNLVEITIGPDARALGQSTVLAQNNPLDVITPDANGVWRFAAATLVEG